METIFLFTIGAWIEENVFSIISFALVVVGAIIWLVRLEASVKHLVNATDKIEETVGETKERLHEHMTDMNIHNNRAHIDALKESMNKLERRVDTVYANIDKKLDRINDIILRGRD